MQTCNNCSNSLEDAQNFCTNCGEKVPPKLEAKKVLDNQINDESVSLAVIEPNELSIDDENSNDVFSTIKEKIPEFSKKKPLIISLVFLIIFVITFTTFSSSHSNSASKMVAKFEKAINKSDTSKLMEIITTNDFSDKLNEFQVSNFNDYLLKNPDTFNYLMSNLKKDANRYDSDNSSNSYYNKASITYIEKVNDDYKIVVNTSNIIINLPTKNVTDSLLDDVVFTIDGTECESEKIDTGTYRINSLLPAKYKVSASINNKYFSCEDSANIDIFKTYQSSTTSSKISLFNDSFKSVKLSTNAESATLYINDVEVRNFTDGTMFSPITKDMKLQAVISNDDKVLKTKTVQWNGTSKTISLEFDDSLLSSISVNGDELLEKNITKLLESYSKNYAKLISNKSYRYVSSYITPGSDLETKQKEYVKTLKGQKIKFKFVSCEVTDIKVSEDNQTITATVKAVYDTTYDNNKSTDTFTSNVKLMYDEKSKKYRISEIN